MAAGLGPAWPQLSPLHPGTGKQSIFTFRWDLGFARASKCPLCLWAGSEALRAGRCWAWIWCKAPLGVESGFGPGLPFGVMPG